MNTALLPYDHPDVQRLIAEVQLEYVQRYGGPDDGPIDAGQFVPPVGGFYVSYLDGDPVAMAGWRLVSYPELVGLVPAEMKRMYVTPGSRGRGLARLLLAQVERAAQAAGAEWLVLETGAAQPEAIALYRSAGYAEIPAYGHYRCSPLAVHLGKRLAPG